MDLFLAGEFVLKVGYLQLERNRNHFHMGKNVIRHRDGVAIFYLLRPLFQTCLNKQKNGIVLENRIFSNIIA